jgi:hypothetical protein
MNCTRTNVKTWLVAVALSVLIGGMAAALPGEASARWRHPEPAGSHARIHKSVKYEKRTPFHGRIHSRRPHGPVVERKVYSKPPRRIVKYHRPPRRTVVVHRPRLRPLGTTIAASFSYHLGVAPHYASAPVYTSVETGVSRPRYTGVQRISVSTDLLNVRSGPGLHSPVICTVGFGDVFPVQGATEGWLSITLPNGRPGWVMAHYTRGM